MGNPLEAIQQPQCLYTHKLQGVLQSCCSLVHYLSEPCHTLHSHPITYYKTHIEYWAIARPI